MRCVICSREERDEVDRRLLAGQPENVIAHWLNLPTIEVMRHNHPYQSPSHVRQAQPERFENFYVERDPPSAPKKMGWPTKQAPPHRMLTPAEVAAKQGESRLMAQEQARLQRERPTRPGVSINQERRRHLLGATYLGQRIIAETGGMSDSRRTALIRKYPSLKFELERGRH